MHLLLLVRSSVTPRGFNLNVDATVSIKRTDDDDDDSPFVVTRDRNVLCNIIKAFPPSFPPLSPHLTIPAE